MLIIILFSLYDGTGFGCESGVKTDIAGVVCGKEEQIDQIKEDKIDQCEP